MAVQLDAVKDFRSVVKVAPNDADARSKLAACEKELKRREFEKAISFDEKKRSPEELIGDVDAMVVEPTYVSYGFFINATTPVDPPNASTDTTAPTSPNQESTSPSSNPSSST